MKIERTTCACRDCSTYCRQMPGYLIPADLPRIARALDLERPADVADYLSASPGAVLASSATGERIRVPTLVPRMVRNRCIFLSDSGKCRIHAVSPYGCSHFDSHMKAEEASRRSLIGLRAIMSDLAAGGLYSQIWQKLHDVGFRSLGPEALRKG